jgi:hypothetical protein
MAAVAVTVTMLLLVGADGLAFPRTVQPPRRLASLHASLPSPLPQVPWLQQASPPLPWARPGLGRRRIDVEPLRQVVLDAWGAVEERVAQFWRRLRRVLSALIVAASSWSGSLGGGSRRGMAWGTGSAAVVAAAVAAPRPAEASLWRKYKDLSPVQKLATTPLFYVCNSGGSPYLQDDVQAGRPEQRIVVYFMSSEVRLVCVCVCV